MKTQLIEQGRLIAELKAKPKKRRTTVGKFDFIDDKECIPLVEFFNENGLKTWMCCSGVDGHGYGFFYIYFDRSITQQDIEYFMSSHLTNKGYCSTRGWFCKRIWWKPDETWAYVADSVDKANADLEYFKRTNKENDNDNQ